PAPYTIPAPGTRRSTRPTYGRALTRLEDNPSYHKTSYVRRAADGEGEDYDPAPQDPAQKAEEPEDFTLHDNDNDTDEEHAHASTLDSDDPKTYHEAMSRHDVDMWGAVMAEEMGQFVRMKLFDEVGRPTNRRVKAACGLIHG
ncbi:uncharacterized protein BXZ73DRAFT_62924, partial [Epithele typhae]|uniref:uncharacterized protein n=1 Tax=Epithele typhae TaxID=378194 RepID=UPI00200840C0